MFGLPPWRRAKPEPEAEPVDEPIGGFQVLTFEELPKSTQLRIIARKAERSNPERVSSDYDELRWE